jgi:ABC-type lipoprotein export system ATPase subunit
MVKMDNCKLRLGPGVEFLCEHFNADAGDQIALWGPSGCGKTTMLNMISGLLRPSEGRITVDGHEIQDMREHELDRFRGARIGFIFQTFNLLAPFTSMQNVLLGMRFADATPGKEWKARATELLERVNLSHRLHSKPTTMSVGEQQRVAIARALANKPPLILADEPTGSLDPRTSREVMDLLLQLCREEQVTLLLVTHDEGIAERLPQRFDCTNLVMEAQKA